MGPGVGAVLGHVDGHIPEQADAQAVAVALQGEPLAEEQVLAKQMIADLPVQLPAAAFQGRGLAAAHLPVRPLGPHDAPVAGLQSGEQGEILHPGILPAEGCQLLLQLALRLGEAAAQELFLAFPHGGVIHPLRVVGGELLPVVVGHQTRLTQGGAGNQHGVSRKHAGGLVGALPIARGAQGEHLPHSHAAGLEKVREGVGLLAQAADAARPGEGGDVHEDTASAHGRLILSMEKLSKCSVIPSPSRR